MYDAEYDAEEENRDRLTDQERNAIASLQRLARRWPRSLELVSMGGGLHVIRVGDPRFGEPEATVRAEAVIETIIGIPNDGGDW